MPRVFSCFSSTAAPLRPAPLGGKLGNLCVAH
uniref:Uncharacterized protein n=1 Tax=Macaca fascicularis TaxID=9541 RepID=Q2PFX8_MACFA|nr:hypothetical protein [Macaca fascicularis]